MELLKKFTDKVIDKALDVSFGALEDALLRKKEEEIKQVERKLKTRSDILVSTN